MSQIKDFLGLKEGETAWEGFQDDEVIIQCKCPHCDKGLIYAPVRYCGFCHGDGYLTRRISTDQPPVEVLDADE